MRRWRASRRRAFVMAAMLACVTACGSPGSQTGTSALGRHPRHVIRITGSDTMVNLVQAWAEHYARVRPDVSIQVAGGGSGVGLAGLIEGIVDIAAAGRRIRADEARSAAARGGRALEEVVVALDALAVYVHAQNPLDAISLPALAEIYGEDGRLEYWSQLAASHAGCPSDRIVRVSRQNNSGTYAYFRQAVLGTQREYKLGSLDQSGSKDVVALVSQTPCAVGFSGMAFATRAVKTLALAINDGAPPVSPTVAAAQSRSYPLARPLYFYTGRPLTGHIKAFIDWTLGPAGQAIVRDMGFAPLIVARTAAACDRS